MTTQVMISALLEQMRKETSFSINLVSATEDVIQQMWNAIESPAAELLGFLRIDNESQYHVDIQKRLEKIKLSFDLSNEQSSGKPISLLLFLPETNLHPATQVLYVNEIVSIMKTMPAHFNITIISIAPDIVQATKYISEKHEVSKNVYLLKKDKEQIVLENKEQSISNIFEEFNKSLDYIEKYGDK